MLFPVSLIVLICCIIFVSVFGNLLVVFSVLLVRKLRQPANILLLSLAVTDLLVSIVVMPGALFQEIYGGWLFGSAACLAWIFCDVFLCTSSILTLTVICVDRFYAISKPLRYVPIRTHRLIGICILSVTLTAGLVSAPAMLDTTSGLAQLNTHLAHNKSANATEEDLPETTESLYSGEGIPSWLTEEPDLYNTTGPYYNSEMVETNNFSSFNQAYGYDGGGKEEVEPDHSFYDLQATRKCHVSQSPAYQLYATIFAFYCPLIVMVVLYTKIYFTARGIIQKERNSPALHRKSSAFPEQMVSTADSHVSEVRNGGNMFSNLSKQLIARWRPDSTNCFCCSANVNATNKLHAGVSMELKEVKELSNNRKRVAAKATKDAAIQDEEKPLTRKRKMGEYRKSEFYQNGLQDTDNSNHDSKGSRNCLGKLKKKNKSEAKKKSSGVLPMNGEIARNGSAVPVRGTSVTSAQGAPNSPVNSPSPLPTIRVSCSPQDHSHSSLQQNVVSEIDYEQEVTPSPHLDVVTEETTTFLSTKTPVKGRSMSASNSLFPACTSSLGVGSTGSEPDVRDQHSSTSRLHPPRRYSVLSSCSHLGLTSGASGLVKSPSMRLSKRFTGYGHYARQEWKATLTVGIVLLTFIICWLPFFVLALYSSLVTVHNIPEWLESTALWLGYANSMLNPLIYGVLNRDFRKTFISILTLKCKHHGDF